MAFTNKDIFALKIIKIMCDYHLMKSGIISVKILYGPKKNWTISDNVIKFNKSSG